MSKKNRRPQHDIEADYNALTKEGYRIVKYSDVHWRVFSKGQSVDVWPTSKKYMATGGDTSHVYTNVVEAVTGLFWKGDRGEDEQAGIDAMVEFKRGLNAKLASMGLINP